MPHASRIAVLWDLHSMASRPAQGSRAAAPLLRSNLFVIAVRSRDDLGDTFAAIRKSRVEAMLSANDDFPAPGAATCRLRENSRRRRCS